MEHPETAHLLTRDCSPSASYNYGLATTGETVKHHEQGHPEAAPDTQASIVRHPTLPITTYEIAIPAAALQAVTRSTYFSPSMTFGVGIAVNDGDLGAPH